jgi:hypothetical protein
MGILWVIMLSFTQTFLIIRKRRRKTLEKKQIPLTSPISKLPYELSSSYEKI